MELQYQITAEDFIAFNRYFMLHNARAKRNMTKDRVLGAIFILGAGGLFGSLQNHMSAVWISVFALCAIVYFFIAPKLLLNSMANRVRKMLKNASSTILGAKTMTLGEEQLRLQGDGEDSTYTYEKVEKIEEDLERYYIFVGELEALILPKEAFTSDAQKTQFFDFLQGKIKK